jgi:hypothetical protein
MLCCPLLIFLKLYSHYSHSSPNLPDFLRLSSYLLKPLPQEIVAEVENRPPLQREEAGKYYIGQRFRWHVLLRNAYKSSNEKDTTIMFREKSDKSGEAPVFVDIPIGKYPSLQTAKKGADFYITGTVSRVKNGIIELTDSIIE